MIRQALLDADLTAGDVDVVEAHGTGTRIGDPIEAEALQATYGKAHSAARPLLVGSVKSNIGHAQYAAGVAGMIKAVQSIRHGVVPATLHLDSPTPQVDWSSGTIEVVGSACPWPDQADRPRRAGVSSFGISGTNAHVILEQAPPESGDRDVGSQASAGRCRGCCPRSRRRRWPSRRPGCGGSSSSTPTLDPHDVAYSLVTTRALFDHRAVAVGAERDELLSGLAAIASGAPAPNVVTGKAAATGGTVFVFPGQGSQWTGMAVELLDSAPAFADQMRLCDAAFAEFVDWSLLEAVRGGAGSPSLDRVDVVQPVLFAVMVSLAAQWRALGIHPDAVLGHSQGEIAAAYVAGALSLRDAAKVVTLRSKAISAIAGTGGMVSIPRPVEQVHALIEPWGQSISIAAQNGPSSTVVTGNAAALDELMAVCERDDVPVTRIPVDYASHSAQVEELRETLRESLSGLRPRTGDIAFISAVTGAGLDTSILDGDYWFANLRQPVLFEQAVRWAYEHGYRTFIESSPHPVLTVGIQESLEDYGDDHSVVGTLRRNEGGMRRFLLSAAEAHVHGKSPNWASMFDDTGARRIDLPTYAFERKRYWMDPGPGFVDASSLGVSRRRASPARCGCGPGRFGRDHSHRSIVARVPSVAGRPQSARGRARAGCGDGGAGATRGRPCGVPAGGPTRAARPVDRRRTRWCRSASRRRCVEASPANVRSGSTRGSTRWCGPGVDTPCRRRTRPDPDATATEEFEPMAAGGRGTDRRFRGLPEAGRARIRIRSGIPRPALGVAPWRRGVRRGGVAGAGEGRREPVRSASGAARRDPARHRCRRHPRRIGADQAAVRMGRLIAACRRRNPASRPDHARRRRHGCHHSDGQLRGVGWSYRFACPAWGFTQPVADEQRCR